MATAINATNGSQIPIVDKDKIGVAGLTSDSFLKLLITQLQNQDPTQPTSNEEILQQLVSMRSLQSQNDLSGALKTLNASNGMTSAAAFLGKFITGTDANNQEITGQADRVFQQDGKTFVGIGENEISIDKITGVSIVPPE